MKAKFSIIIGLASILSGFIPLSFNSKHDISFVIYTNNINNANLVKEELIDFYKQNCFSSSFNKIEEKINSYINEFKYESSYIDGCINIHYNQENIKMMGYLYKTTPSFINFKYYFTGTTNSIPEATSIKVETLTVSDQI